MRGRTAWATPGRARLYLVLWPFFIWWTLALLFSFAAPLALALALHASARRRTPRCSRRCRWRPPARRCRCTSGRASARRDVEIDGLPEAFDGYRIVQISDLHCGPFASGRRVARWVGSANRLEADLVAVTGDLIASGSAFIDVVARALGGLRARDGAFAAMGNHDYFGDGEAMVSALEAAGLTVLRNRGVELRRESGAIYLAGVDDTWTRRHDLGRALAGAPGGNARGAARARSRPVSRSRRAGRGPGAVGPHPRRSGGRAAARAQAEPRPPDHAVHERRVQVRAPRRCM